jgi:creatinine amidohydrolase
VHIEPEHFISFCLDITKSVAYHGFKKIVVVNGHGSNTPLADLVARKTTLETPALCCATNYFAFGTEAFATVQETPVIAHADEFETSLYLHIAPERVRTDQIVEGNDVVGKYVSSDSTSPYVRFSDYWGRWTNKGVHGYPRSATAEKGKLIYESTVAGMVEFIDEWRAWPIPERSDQHDGTAQKQIRW